MFTVYKFRSATESWSMQSPEGDFRRGAVQSGTLVRSISNRVRGDLSSSGNWQLQWLKMSRENNSDVSFYSTENCSFKMMSCLRQEKCWFMVEKVVVCFNNSTKKIPCVENNEAVGWSQSSARLLFLDIWFF